MKPRPFHWLSDRWRTTHISEVNLGKYIILFASVMHIGWGTLLFISPSAGASTPVNVLVRVFGGPIRTGIVLYLVAVVALLYLFLPHRINPIAMALMLIPQQTVLLMSAGAGLVAVFHQMYADGVARPWEFILADQLPVILAALLYTAVVLEAGVEGDANESG